MPNNSNKIRFIAFYLPQYHPIPENDLWWGKGFTEWTNVTKAVPLFEGHYQPHLPTDFGFYDLRLRETRRDQIQIAKHYGIDGFCYHYYWFSGKRVLNQPLDDMLQDPQSDMPFCLCWANENWTRRWDGLEHEVLLEQKYLPDDDINFIKDISPFLKDQRYIKINGMPILIIYRPQQFPNPKNTVKIWRNYCRDIGIGEIHLSAALTFGNTDYIQFGFDSGLEFPPHNLKVNKINMALSYYKPFKGRIYFYHDIANFYLNKKYPGGNVYRTVFPSWDNTSRAGNSATIIINGTPENYEYWLAQTMLQTTNEYQNWESFVFINAWNEWAEGCHLEPDRKFQRQFLEATLRAKTGTTKCKKFEHTQLPAFIYFHQIPFHNLGRIIKYYLLLFSWKLNMWLKQYQRIWNITNKFILLLQTKAK